MADAPLLGLSAVALLGVALIARRVSGTWLYPPSLFALVWSAMLAMSVVVRFGDLGFSPVSLLVFVVGAILYLIGGLSASWLIERTTGAPHVTVAPPSLRAAVRLCALACGVALLAIVPRFIAALRDAAAVLSVDDFAVGARSALSLQYGQLVPRWYQSVSSAGTIIAYVVAAVVVGGLADRLLLALAVGAPLAMLALTFARTPVFALVVGVAGILAVRRRLPRAAAIAIALAAVAGALVMGTLLGKGPDVAGSATGAEAVVRSVGVYAVGGPLGFSAVMSRPTEVGEPGVLYRFVTQALVSAGMDLRLPDNVLGEKFAALGNVYSYYFAYWLDLGWVGIAIAGLFGGAAMTALFEGARRGSIFCLAGFGIVFPAILNAGTGDFVFSSSVPWILLGVVVLALRALAAAFELLGRRARRPLAHPAGVDGR